MYLIER